MGEAIPAARPSCRQLQGEEIGPEARPPRRRNISASLASRNDPHEPMVHASPETGRLDDQPPSRDVADPAGRGLSLLAVMSAALGFATKRTDQHRDQLFEQILHLKGPEFGYITAIREVGGFILIFVSAVLYASATAGHRGHCSSSPSALASLASRPAFSMSSPGF